MISMAFVSLLGRFDNEISINPGIKDKILLTICETFLWKILLFFKCSSGVAMNKTLADITIILFVFYTLVTAYIDAITGFVYRYFNIFVGGMLVILGVIAFGIKISLIICGVLFCGFLKVCEMTGAFCNGDSQVYLVIYFFMHCFLGGDALDFMLITMLLSSVIFGIYRKITGRKEGYVPFTPFIFFSEYILIIILCFMRT